MLDGRIALVIALLAPACDSTKKDCEHAREVMASEWERNAKAAIATVEAGQRHALKTASAKEVTHLRRVFVDICVAQPESARACVAKIDDFLRVKREQQTDNRHCGVHDAACHAAAKPAAESPLLDCEEPLDALMKAVSDGL